MYILFEGLVRFELAKKIVGSTLGKPIENFEKI
jgi:hypothetical protein